MAEHRCLWDANYPECPERLTHTLERWGSKIPISVSRVKCMIFELSRILVLYFKLNIWLLRDIFLKGKGLRQPCVAKESSVWMLRNDPLWKSGDWNHLCCLEGKCVAIEILMLTLERWLSKIPVDWHWGSWSLVKLVVDVQKHYTHFKASLTCFKGGESSVVLQYWCSHKMLFFFGGVPVVCMYILLISTAVYILTHWY